LREGCGGTCGMWHEMRCHEMRCCVFLCRLALALAPSSFPDALATLLSRRRSLYSIPVFSAFRVVSIACAWVGYRRSAFCGALFVLCLPLLFSLYCSARARARTRFAPTHPCTHACAHTHAHTRTHMHARTGRPRRLNGCGTRAVGEMTLLLAHASRASLGSTRVRAGRWRAG
jgi:hypothetical protein